MFVPHVCVLITTLIPPVAYWLHVYQDWHFRYDIKHPGWGPSHIHSHLSFTSIRISKQQSQGFPYWKDTRNITVNCSFKEGTLQPSAKILWMKMSNGTLFFLPMLLWMFGGILLQVFDVSAAEQERAPERPVRVNNPSAASDSSHHLNISSTAVAANASVDLINTLLKKQLTWRNIHCKYEFFAILYTRCKKGVLPSVVILNYN